MEHTSFKILHFEMEYCYKYATNNLFSISNSRNDSSYSTQSMVCTAAFRPALEGKSEKFWAWIRFEKLLCI